MQLFQGIVDQTINARSVGPVVDIPLPDPNDWGHHPSLSRSLQTVPTPTLPSSESMSRVYPDSGVVRDFVPPFYKSWSVVYLSYNPPSYSQSPELWGSPAGLFLSQGELCLTHLLMSILKYCVFCLLILIVIRHSCGINTEHDIARSTDNDTPSEFTKFSYTTTKLNLTLRSGVQQRRQKKFPGSVWRER